MPDMQAVLNRPDVEKYTFHSCMWGGDRKKNTVFVTNLPQLQDLEKTCDAHTGSHTHDPWRVRWSSEKGTWQFATAEECEYPRELCEKVAAIAALAARAPPALPRPVRRKQKSRHGPAQAAERATVGKQSRRHRRPGAVPE